jgi:hypothetical protein
LLRTKHGARIFANANFAAGGVIHNLPSPCSAGPLRSAMNNSGTDISFFPWT